MTALMTPEELFAIRDGVTTIDVRWRLGGPHGRLDYLADHIPGATFIDLDEELCGPPGEGGRHPLPDPAKLQEVLRRAGVRADRPVVAYDYSDGMAAARLWWTLRWAGHRDARVLDGGYAAWQAAGLPVDSHAVVAEPGDFVVRPGKAPLVDADGAAAIAANGVLIDARVAPRFRGEIEPVDKVAGRIPGAVNIPYADLVESDGRLRSASELRKSFDSARGARVGAMLAESASPPASGARVGAYCGSGVTAAHTILALSEAGIDAALYVGSWSHWITDPNRPIATGDEP